MKTKPTMPQIDPSCIILGLSEEREGQALKILFMEMGRGIHFKLEFSMRKPGECRRWNTGKETEHTS